MIYKNQKDYNRPQANADLWILRSWLLGQTSHDTLRTWLAALQE